SPNDPPINDVASPVVCGESLAGVAGDTHHDPITFTHPLSEHHAPTSFSRKLNKSFPVAFTSYKGCWGQNWFQGSEWTNPAVGGPYANDAVNKYDGCDCGDG